MMVLEVLLTPVFALLRFILSLIPDMSYLDVPYAMVPFYIPHFIYILSYGFFLFPAELFLIFIGNVIFWLVAQLGWAIIEWAYKKVPGVN